LTNFNVGILMSNVT